MLQRFVLLFAFSFCVLTLYAQDFDSLRHTKDSALPMPLDPFTFFDRAEKISAPEKTLVVTQGKRTLSLKKFLASLNTSIDSGFSSSDHALADLDNDGTKELIISNFTGGAHCCDELYILKNIGPNKYQHTAKLFAGNSVITDTGAIIYDFHEQYGYFFTCFACGYSDTSDAAAVPIHAVSLRYIKGKIVPVTGDKELRSTINDNLAKLTELPYETPDEEFGQDSGIRKEIAMNLAVFYYSFGKNIKATKALFDKYYRFPDARNVWSAFVKQLDIIENDSSI